MNCEHCGREAKPELNDDGTQKGWDEALHDASCPICVKHYLLCAECYESIQEQKRRYTL